MHWLMFTFAMTTTTTMATNLSPNNNIIISKIVNSIPSEYDGRALRPNCAAWRTIMNQGGIASCCSFAMATALSARECLRDGRNSLYSPQQIWDCSGPSISNTENGTLLQHLISEMGDTSNFFSSQFLVPYDCASTHIQSEPNLTRCSQTFAACHHPGVIIPPIKTSAGFRLSTYYSGPPDYGVILAARYMMLEIMQNGPVIGVLETRSNADRMRFEALDADTIFIPIHLDPLVGGNEGYHCIVVYGWGVESGIHFWRVQNSYGTDWANRGVGRIIRGTLERNWRSVSTPSRPCPSSKTPENEQNNNNINITHNNQCIYSPLLLRNSTTTVSDEEEDTRSSIPATAANFISNKNNHFYHHYPFFKSSNTTSQIGLVAISNEVIIIITLATSLVVGTLLYTLMRLVRKRNSAQLSPASYYYYHYYY